MGEIQQPREALPGGHRYTRRRVLQTFAGLSVAGASGFLLGDGYALQPAAAAAAVGGAVESEPAARGTDMLSGPLDSQLDRESGKEVTFNMPQWNEYDTAAYSGVIAETISYPGHNGDLIHAYYARPMGPGPFPGIALVHHAPGWDEFYREMAYRFANHGCAVLAPDLNCRYGHGTPDQAVAKARAAGGLPDDQVVGDMTAASYFLRAQPTSNGRVGIIGTSSGGRHAFLAAARQPDDFHAVADLWGGRVVMSPQDLTPNTPVAPLDYTKNLKAPLLGLFGNDDRNPTPEHVDILEAALKEHGKRYEFHRYDGAGHGFFYYHTANYRPQQAMDGWSKVFRFFDRELKAR